MSTNTSITANIMQLAHPTTITVNTASNIQWQLSEIAPKQHTAIAELEVDQILRLKIVLLARSGGYSCYINGKLVEWYDTATIEQAQHLFASEVVFLVRQMLEQI
jgi:hypothetical protein